MDGNTTIFNDAAVFLSAGAAVVSAICAYLSQKPSRRDMIDILKVEILQVAYTEEGRDSWVNIVHNSEVYEDYFGPNPESLAVLLSRKYRKKKWVNLILPALEELKREGYRDVLDLHYPFSDEDDEKNKQRVSQREHK